MSPARNETLPDTENKTYQQADNYYYPRIFGCLFFAHANENPYEDGMDPYHWMETHPNRLLAG